MKSPVRIACAIFLAVFTLLLAMHSNRIVATNDEGILLDAAQRVANGQRPYVDFWAYMTPGSYWLQAVLFKLLGVSLFAARLIVIFDFALQCALVFWLTAKLASSRAAWFAKLAFLGFQMADPSFLTAQHRWDSSTWALAGVAMAIVACSRGAHSRGQWIAAGAVMAVAAWCTPTTGMVLIVTAGWLAWQPARRASLAPLLCGAAVPFALGAVWLISNQGLIPMVEQILWLRKNYMVNAMPYGSIVGGYAALFEDLSGNLDLTIRVILVSCVALPAILPIVALLGWGWLLRGGKLDADERNFGVLCLLAAAALILALSPRPDVMHLAFVVALPYVLSAAAFSKLIPDAVRIPGGMIAVLLAVVFSMHSFSGLGALTNVASPVGNLRVDNKQGADMQKLLATVHPGNSLFVYPYMPMHYFVTQGRNPTVYSFFSPGMATKREALDALAQLQQQPPEWLLYMKISTKELLRVVPKGESVEWRYPELEGWLEENYAPEPETRAVVAGYELRRRRGPQQLLRAAER